VLGNAEEWLRIYLSGRCQRVCVEQATSCWANTKIGGSAQGSILGPLMFVLFVSDLLQAIRCGSINMYATLYTAAKMIEETIDTFRTDAQSTLDWYTAVCIDLTNSKQKVLCT